jgi:hypothetical protein
MTLRNKGGFKMTLGAPASAPLLVTHSGDPWIAPASRQFAEETQATKPAAPVRTTPPPRMVDGAAHHEAGVRTILPGAPLGQNASDVTGICDTLDRGHHNVSHDSAETVHQSCSIANESGRDLDDKGLHVGCLWVN